MRTRRFDPFNSMHINFLTELVQGVFWSTVISKQNSIHRFQVCTLVKVRFFYLHSVPDKMGCKNSLGQGGAKMGQDGAKMCQDEPRWRQWVFFFGGGVLLLKPGKSGLKPGKNGVEQAAFFMRTRRFVPESQVLAAVNRVQQWAFSNLCVGFLLLKPGKNGVHKTVFV